MFVSKDTCNISILRKYSQQQKCYGMSDYVAQNELHNSVVNAIIV